MGLISIYLLRFFQNVTFLAAWLSDMPLTKTENTERGFKRNFLKSDLSDWFVKTEKSSSHTFWYWSHLQHLRNYNSDKKHHLSLNCKYFKKPLIFVLSYYPFINIFSPCCLEMLRYSLYASNMMMDFCT